MAERRMFAKSIVLSDAFLDMPMSARCLYFTLGMLADDDGFVGSPKSIMRQCGATQDDLAILISKRYVLGFESGIIVIKHWRMNNYLKNDRHKDTTYLDELATLTIDERGAYTELSPKWIQNGYKVDTQVSIGKNSIDKISIDKIKHKHGEFENVLLTDEELNKLKQYPKYEEYIQRLSSYMGSKGVSYKSHYITILNWMRKDGVKPIQKEDECSEEELNALKNELKGMFKE